MLHIAWINESAGPTGGCERYVFDTATLLAERGHRSTLFYDPRLEADSRYLEAFDASFPLVEARTQLDAAEPDLVYLHRWSDVSLLGDLVSSRVPTLRFFHDHRLFCLREHKYTTLGRTTCERSVGWGCYGCLGFVNRSEQWPGLRLSRVGALLDEQKLNQQLDGFVVASDYMSGHLRLHGFDESRIHKIPLFTAACEDPSGAAMEEDLLLFVGALTTGKGLDVLLEAMSRLSVGARLIVAGEGPQAGDFRRLTQRLGLEQRVEFVGRLGRSEVAELYRRALALVLPARAPETFALVGPEAMSHATAVVATDVGGVREWLVDGRNGLLVPSGSAGRLAAALERLLLEPATAERMGREGAALYQQRFRPERHAATLASVMQEVVN